MTRDARILLALMREQWQRSPALGRPRGNRIFVRWVSVSEEDAGWYGWVPIALIRGDEVVCWNCRSTDCDCTDEWLTCAREGLACGQLAGEGELDGKWWQWVRASIGKFHWGRPRKRWKLSGSGRN